jgi:hypothetical protein
VCCGSGFLLSLAALSARAAPPAAEPGHVYYQRLAAPDLDRWTNSPDKQAQRWFRDHFFRMGVFTPYFDSKTSWYPNALFYRNLYGLPPDSHAYGQHPDWALRDSRGHPLYIPWNCNGSTCPQYAGDIANPAFRQFWIDEARATLSHGYLGLWIDDVNTEFRVSDGAGKQVAPMDRASGQPMTWAAWRGYVAAFAEQIRAAFPKAEIVHNSIWFAGPEGTRDADAAIHRQIAAADNLNIERGIATDKGLTGGSGIWSVHALFDYIDRVHAAGRGVTLEEYNVDRRGLEYSLAGYFLISSGRDRIGDGGTNPGNWWSGFDVELGSPAGPRTWHDGIFQRTFSGGIVLLGEPGISPRKVSLPHAFSTLGKEKVTSVEIEARQGIILLNAP